MVRHFRRHSIAQIYHVMIRGIEKKDIFLDLDDRHKFLRILGDKKQEKEYQLLAYCIMNNHVHLLLKEEEMSVSKTMQRINTSYAHYFNRKYNRVGPVFQDRFKSEAVEDEEYLFTALRYIHNNPVKSGLVQEAKQYKWSSFLAYLGFFQNRKHLDPLVDLSLVLDIFELAEIINPGEAIPAKNVEMEPGSMPEVEQILAEILKLKGCSDLASAMDNGQLRQEVVKYLRDETQLTIRELAEFLGVGKTTIHRLLIS